MPAAPNICPICKFGPHETVLSDGGERISISCPRCGPFQITATAARIAERAGISNKLSALIRSKSYESTDQLEIDSQSLKTLQDALPDYTVSEKLLLLMRAIERKSNTPGTKVELDPEIDYPICWAASAKEFGYLLACLEQRKLVSGALRTDRSFVTLTADGWEYLEKNRGNRATSNQAFVAMSFSPNMASAWTQGIRGAIKKAKFSPYRIDSALHNERIDVKIIAEIRNSKFLVADVTEQKAGVYFEAGYALGIQIPVIWSVREDELAKVHFDTRQYNHIVWKGESDLASQLYDHIRAIVGRGSGT